MVIQTYSSRFETPRVAVCNEAFAKLGIDIYSSQNIPFAGRTSEFFANSMVTLLISRIKNLPPRGHYHIYEFGVGNGILAKRILSLLKKTHNELYKKITLHLIDSSPTLIKELGSLNIFSTFKGHVTIELADATTYRYPFPPFFVYFTNLIDSLPCRHIRMEENGKAYEVTIKTFAQNNTFAEETRLVPIEKVKNMLKDERSDLKKLISSRNKNEKPQVFNYPYGARKFLISTIKQLVEGGFVLFSDFGTTSYNQKASLWSEYGLAIFFSVDFAGLRELAKNLDKSTYLVTKNPQEPQELLIDTLDDASFANTFSELFNKDFEPEVNTFLTMAEAILFSKNINSMKLQKVRSLYNKLQPPVKQDYRLLNDYAYFLLQAHLYKESLRMTDELKKQYGHTVGKHYSLIRDTAIKNTKGD